MEMMGKNWKGYHKAKYTNKLQNPHRQGNHHHGKEIYINIWHQRDLHYHPDLQAHVEGTH